MFPLVFYQGFSCSSKEKEAAAAERVKLHIKVLAAMEAIRTFKLKAPSSSFRIVSEKALVHAFFGLVILSSISKLGSRNSNYVETGLEITEKYWKRTRQDIPGVE